jgi:hypothetical protein
MYRYKVITTHKDCKYSAQNSYRTAHSDIVLTLKMADDYFSRDILTLENHKKVYEQRSKHAQEAAEKCR